MHETYKAACRLVAQLLLSVFLLPPPPLVIVGLINYPYPITAQVKVTFINTSWLMFGCTGGIQEMQSYCSFHSYDFDCD